MHLNIKKIIFFSSIISILAYEDLAAMEKNYPVNYVRVSSDAELRTFCHISDKMYCYPSFEMENKNLALTQDFYEKVFIHIYNVNAKIAKDNGHLIIFNYCHVPEIAKYFEATKAYFEPIAKKKKKHIFFLKTDMYLKFDNNVSQLTD
jgi:hypothetical protein